MHKTREPFNVNMLSQAAAIACLDHWDEVPGRARRNREQLDWTAGELEALGFEVVPSQTNFVLVRLPGGNAGELGEALLRKGVIVRPMHAFGLGEGAIRISIGLPEENRRCIEAVTNIDVKISVNDAVGGVGDRRSVWREGRIDFHTWQDGKGALL